MVIKKLWGMLLVALLLGCGGNVDPAATVVPSPAPTLETVAEAESAPTATAIPPEPTSTSIPATPTPAATAVPPTATATPALPDVPGLVWLPYATGNYGQPVLMQEKGEITTQALPVEVEIFFDYQPESGWLAYGSKFWEPTVDQKSVTDLHIYSFANGRDEVWAGSNVGRAALSPTGKPAVAAAIHNGRGFDLIIKPEPATDLLLVEDIDPYFAWSPDGSQIAYLRDGELFVTSAAGDSGSAPIASGLYVNSGWIGDAPLWLGDSGYLLFADAPFTIVASDGSATIVPTTLDGAPLQGPRPFAMLFSPTTNQLIAESEGMFGPSVLVYRLGDGFETAELVEQIDDAQLAGWYEENESVLIVSSGEPTILPLTPQE